HTPVQEDDVRGEKPEPYPDDERDSGGRDSKGFPHDDASRGSAPSASRAHQRSFAASARRSRPPSATRSPGSFPPRGVSRAVASNTTALGLATRYPCPSSELKS